jgi:hypothetical protein
MLHRHARVLYWGKCMMAESPITADVLDRVRFEETHTRTH